MRIRRRELAAAFMLYRLYGASKVNMGEALDTLKGEFCVTRRTAVNIVRRLGKLGFLRVLIEGGSLKVEIMDPVSVLEARTMDYVKSRREKCTPK
ncbi:MAG: hypothetical protein P3X22_003280 [Thermoprotei archaeon]|nr:hypothetical protein [Thermoprotei archaeon]